MDTPKIFDSELKLCEILWQHQPVKSWCACAPTN